MTKPHQMLKTGFWECPAIAKLVDERTVNKGFLACGHCVHVVLDEAGNKVEWSMAQQFEWRKTRKG